MTLDRCMEYLNRPYKSQLETEKAAGIVEVLGTRTYQRLILR